MTKAPPRQSKQLEIPLFVDLNAKRHLPRNRGVMNGTASSINSGVDGTSSLEASADDLTIYRAISENFFRQFK